MTDENPTPAPLDETGGEAQLREALAQAEATAQEHWSKYLRTAAELDNARKRAAREVEQARKFGVERLAAELLGVLDSLEMGLEAGPGASAESLLEGKRATLRLLQAALEKSGLNPVEAAGQKFDPQLHEALSVQPSAEVEPGAVMAVIQKGYQLNGRLLRPARVIVASAIEGAPAGGTDSEA